MLLQLIKREELLYKSNKSTQETELSEIFILNDLNLD